MIQHSEATTKARAHKEHFIRLFCSAIPNVESETSDAGLLSARLVAFANFALNVRLFIARKHGDSCLNIWAISSNDWLKDV